MFRTAEKRTFLPFVFLLLLAFSAAGFSFFFSLDDARAQLRSYDVVVTGGEPAGVAAAVAAARQGARVLLVIPEGRPGGLITVGGLNTLDMNYGPRGELLTRGIFLEMLKGVGGDSFDVERAEKVLRDMLAAEENVTVWLNAVPHDPVVRSDGTLEGLRVRKGGDDLWVSGKTFIDATADAHLAVAAGVPHAVGREDIGRPGERMAVTLVFQVGGVDWAAIQRYLREDGDPLSGANDRSAWGYGESMRRYRPVEEGLKLRGLNIGRQADGSVFINALLIFGVDGLDPESVREGRERGLREIPRIVDYIRAVAPGFERAYLMGAAEGLYIRETRYIRGLYRLEANDLLEHRNFWDRIALASYPLDLQPTHPEDSGLVLGNPQVYSIPFRSLVPVNVRNLLVVGRSASYSSLAAGSARVVPVGVAQGEAAGVAAAMAIREGLDFHRLAASPSSIRRLQETLVRGGAYLPDFTPPRLSDWDHWAYPAARTLRSYALISSGYQDTLRLDDPVNRRGINRIVSGVSRLVMDHYGLPPLGLPEALPGDPDRVTVEEALNLLYETVRVLDGVLGGLPDRDLPFMRPWWRWPRDIAGDDGSHLERELRRGAVPVTHVLDRERLGTALTRGEAAFLGYLALRYYLGEEGLK